MTDDRYLHERKAEMQVAVAHTSAAISFLELQNCKMDRWEKTCLIDAINGVFRGLYLYASTSAYLALTPEDERVPNSEIKWSLDLQEDQIDFTFLKNLFSIVQLEGVRMNRIFM